MTLEELMKRAGIETFKELEKESGVSYISIWQIANTDRVPRLPIAKRLAKALDCDLSEIKNKKPKKRKVTEKNKDSICWGCANSVPDRKNGCSWSRAFIPVTGWDAEPSEKPIYKGEHISYCVRSCPEYKKDDVADRDSISDDGFKQLGDAIIKVASRDYKEACERELRKRKTDTTGLMEKRSLYQGHYVQIYGKYTMIDGEMESIERFMLSQEAEFFSDINGSYVLREIRKICGL